MNEYTSALRKSPSYQYKSRRKCIDRAWSQEHRAACIRSRTSARLARCGTRRRGCAGGAGGHGGPVGVHDGGARVHRVCADVVQFEVRVGVLRCAVVDYVCDVLPGHIVSQVAGWHREEETDEEDVHMCSGRKRSPRRSTRRWKEPQP